MKTYYWVDTRQIVIIVVGVSSRIEAILRNELPVAPADIGQKRTHTNYK